MSYGDDFTFTLFTNDAQLAQSADAAGIDRIGLDLEKIGKNERQEGLKSWISDHEESHLPAVRDILRSADLFCRTNPVHKDSKAEIDSLIRHGVQVLMLPMFTTVKEAATFIEMVDRRAKVSLLVENVTAAMRIHEIVKLQGIDEIHIGLNDFHLSARLNSHFEVLTSDFLDCLSAIIRNSGIPFGFGGVGRLSDDSLPVPSDLVYAQYPRLEATRALISRVFIGNGMGPTALREEVQQCRNRLDYWQQQPDQELENQRKILRQLITEKYSR
jgi:hypothetical protein